MHVRYSTALGLPVVEGETDELLGVLTGILLHPDTGKVEGFFVRDLFLAAGDIAHWGTVVRVRDADVLAPLEDRIRLASIVEDGRTVIGQRMVTESGSSLGVCKDVQFETATFIVEWFFPKTLFRWKPAIPFSSIVEVRVDAIVVRDVQIGVKEGGRGVLRTLEKIAPAPAPAVPSQGV